jgi:transcriptional regulator with XRE-family HTH domain
MPQAREELERRRQQLGLTQEAAAEAIGVATPTYKAWEQGTRTPLVGFRPRIARVMQASLVEVQRWFDKLTPAPSGVTVPSWLGTFAALEQGAGELWSYEPVLVPGLIQTAAYAAAAQRDDIVEGPPSGDEVDRWVGYRLARQAVLTREPDPLRLSVVIDESVLYRVIGDGEVMFDQLVHLATQAEQPTIDVRVLPLDPGTAVVGWGSFTVLTSPGSVEPYMAVTSDRTGAHYFELPSVVTAHSRLFEHLQVVALPPADTIDLIRTVAKERYTP